MPLNEPQQLKATLNGPQRLGGTLAVTGLTATIGIAGPPGPQGPPGPSGAVFFWRADANSTAPNDPGAGKLRWNASPQASATALYVDWLTDGDFDVHTIFQLMEVSTRFLIQDADFAQNYQVWEMTGAAINHPDWFEVPVTFVSSAGAAEFTHNQRVGVWIEAQTVPMIVQDEGLELPRQHTINFVGTGVTASNDEAGGRITITIPGAAEGAVTSVFTRIGDVVANNGDYTAEQVTNAVSTDGAYPDPAWITSLSWAKITGEPTTYPPDTHTHPWGDITGAPSTFPPTAHVHAAADTTSGVFATARLGAGAASSSVFLRGDSAWAAVPAGAAQTPWTSDINAAGFSLGGATSVSSVHLQASGNVYALTGAVYTAYVVADIECQVGPSPRTAVLSTPQDGAADSGALTISTRYLGALGERMRISAAGNMGIGRSDPPHKLSMDGGNIFMRDQTADNALFINIQGAAVALDARNYAYATSKSFCLQVDGGNVGIGTSAPGSKLSVISTASIDGVGIASLNRASLWLTITNGISRNWLIQTAVAASDDLQFLVSSAGGGAPANPIMVLESAAIKMLLGGSLKTLSVDGGGFVKAA